MEKVQFKISAKAAQLIGRENITDVEGAITELVKNAYDADAECVFIKYYVPFPYVPLKIDLTEFGVYFSKDEMQVLNKYYYRFDNGLKRRSEIELDQSEEKLKLEVQKILFSKNTIVILDNGSGMSKQIIENDWMHIGTSNKESNSISKKGRIKTGAKGIGRFALDKLSRISTMHTKQLKKDLVYWQIDWDQFTNTKLLNDIDAYLEEKNDSFIDNIKRIIGTDFDKIEKHKWETGTMIVLSPLREEWNTKLFKKVNRSLNSINPLGNVDKFDIIVSNTFFPEHNYISDSKKELEQSLYDYKIAAEFNGREELTVSLYRNEVDCMQEEIILKFPNDKTETIDADEFWLRENINRPGYSLQDYGTKYSQTFNVIKLWENSKKQEDKDNLTGLKNLGPFKFTFFFAKKISSDVEIIKRLKNTKARQEILEKFAGIKLYRDSFKVRPYGEEEGLFDWLGLGGRHLKNPSSVSSDAKWSVDPYGLIGYVEISRDKNSLLYDQANREGLVNNKEYYAFISLLLKAINAFEDDRQLYYREFGKLKKKYKPKTSEDVAETLREQKESKKNKDSSVNEDESKKDKGNQDEEFSNKELEEALLEVFDEKQRIEKAWKAFYAFSSSGILANTFAHEVSAIATDLSTRANQLKICLDYFLEDKPMEGLDDYNPYLALEASQVVDKLLETWVKIIIDGIDRQKLAETENNIFDLLNQINELWKPLLEKKKINVDCKIEKGANFNVRISKSDLHIIINNFNLNSAWFLKDVKKKREISYKLIEQGDKIRLIMENNGPPMDAAYKDFPLRMFEIGETSKIFKDDDGKEIDKGTGLGLWIVKEISEKNNCQVVPVVQEEGFRIDIVFDKE